MRYGGVRGGIVAIRGRRLRGKKRDCHPWFGENRGGWGNKKAAVQRLSAYQLIEELLQIRHVEADTTNYSTFPHCSYSFFNSTGRKT